MRVSSFEFRDKTRGSGDRVTWSLQDKSSSQHLVSQVGGRLAEGLGRRTYSRRLEDPRLAGGYALISLLKDMGVKVSGEPKLGKVSGEPRISLWTSKPIAELTRALGKDSNNFYAEMLFVALSGAADGEKESDQPWSSSRGAAVVEEWLKAKHIDLKGIVIKNGSGLFDGNRYSAELLVTLLAGLEDNPRIYQDFVSQLAIGGTDGTMKSRMKGEDLAPRIRAKTGTLSEVLALSGYIQRTKGRSPAAFSITISGIAGRYSQVRSHMDNTVLAWAKILEDSSPPATP
jgi:D-alanyl-D-alanine carboxypeptidase/D-alanyl-D-alanine-endopeptidase (penicillin-binding protein 4)